ncbi:MAG: hypothetical protein J2O46_08855 [Nocardioides sp.]|nr:hypothetical protein [Nocardioides sp.]
MSEQGRVRIAIVALLTLLLPALVGFGSASSSEAALAVGVATALALIALTHLRGVTAFALVRAHSTVHQDVSAAPQHLAARVSDPVRSPRRPRAPGQV